MFSSDNTCCVCRERGKVVQIHHLDEDPTNHLPANLAVLCLDCHDQTQITGGFGRRLAQEVVARYRAEWLDRVASRRDRADRIVVAKLVGAGRDLPQAPVAEEGPPVGPIGDPLEYVNTLPERRRQLRLKAQAEWDTGVTARMVQASYDYIDALQAILVTLASWFPTGHFGSKTPPEFFAEQVSSRFAWHRSYAEPLGPGTGGTIVNVICASSVVTEVEKMVEDIAVSLMGYDERFDWRSWPKQWRDGEGQE